MVRISGCDPDDESSILSPHPKLNNIYVLVDQWLDRQAFNLKKRDRYPSRTPIYAPPKGANTTSLVNGEQQNGTPDMQSNQL